jgi:hypothetical protein
VQRRTWVGAASLAVVIGMLVAASGSVATASPGTDTSALRTAVTPAGVVSHLQALKDIANANGGTRASGSPGFDASADYVAGLLEAAGYQVTRQPFDFAFFEETAPPAFARTSTPARVYVPGTDFLTMDYSGSGTVSGLVQGVDLVLPPTADPTSTSGCEAADFAGFTPGNVALIQRGTCPFGEKVVNAEAAGAIAAIIFNEGNANFPERIPLFGGTLGAPVGIPAISVSFADGNELASLGSPAVTIETHTTSEIRPTENVIAETPGGRADRTVVVGAHLDSVPAGPGINDNGSGTATILEVALQLAALNIQPYNKVRFAFWGAEEAGGPAGCRALRGQPAQGTAQGHHAQPELRHGRLAQLRTLRLRRRRLGDRGFGPTGVRPDRAGLPGLLPGPGARHRADCVRRPVGLRPVHRRGHSRRRPLHRR